MKTLTIIALLSLVSTASAQQYISVGPQAIVSRRSVVIQPRQTFIARPALLPFVRPQRVIVAPQAYQQRVIVAPQRVIVAPQAYQQRVIVAPQRVIAVPQRVYVAPQFQFNAGNPEIVCPQQLNGGY